MTKRLHSVLGRVGIDLAVDLSAASMLRSRLLRPAQTVIFSRSYATGISPHALVFIEHRSGVIDSGSLSALTAAEQLGGKVTGLIVGGTDEVKLAVEKAKK